MVPEAGHDESAANEQVEQGSPCLVFHVEVLNAGKQQAGRRNQHIMFSEAALDKPRIGEDHPHLRHGQRDRREQ